MASVAPDGLGPAGLRLWHSIADPFELEPHELVTLGSAAVIADRIAALDAEVETEGEMVMDTRRRVKIANPALVEARQQRLAQARLLSSLRLPDQNNVRPQQRGGPRGFYAVKGAG